MALKLTVILLILLFAVMKFAGRDTGVSPFAEYPGASPDEALLSVAPLDLPDTAPTSTPDPTLTASPADTAPEAASPPEPETALTDTAPAPETPDGAEALDARAALDMVVIDPNATVNSLGRTAPAANAPSPRNTLQPEPQRGSATETPPLAEVTGTAVNLRAGPSTGSAVLGRAVSGEVVEWLSDPAPGWALIRHPQIDTEVYMSSDFLRRLAN